MTEKEYKRNFAILDKQFEFHLMQHKLELTLKTAEELKDYAMVRKLKEKIQQHELIWRMK